MNQMEELRNSEDLAERRELCLERLRTLQEEESVPEEYRDYFKTEAEKLLLIFEYETKVSDGSFAKLSLSECRELFDRLYAEVLPVNDKIWTLQSFCEADYHHI